MTKLTCIVNLNDEITGYKKREEITEDDIYRVSALWVYNSQGEILLAQRSFTKKKGPGLWGPAVAGTVEEDETYEINIYKEAEEEIGLLGYTFTLGAKELRNTPSQYFVQWYSLCLDEEYNFIPLKEEVEAIKWVSKDELKREILHTPEKFVKGMIESSYIGEFLK